MSVHVPAIQDASEDAVTKVRAEAAEAEAAVLAQKASVADADTAYHTYRRCQSLLKGVLALGNVNLVVPMQGGQR
ncbi:hypothetical protein ColTof4_14078 [Colletotrichum tofieldiae]|nr:hypothetical protein ColTof3_14715 [Colletotrichum tofieldiae]GKT81655.1 hypothetical protein ColTof4_14078 [Colletotrichum tofieldiae]GKT97627.1 hypothetical protein Ct61P_15477 [Colletotrichum tofieldiae]